MTTLKRLTMPKSWPTKRKGITFITRPAPGPHSSAEGIPITVVLKDILGYTKTTRECKKILQEGKITVDNVVRKDHRFIMGILDVLSIPSTKEHYILTYSPTQKFMLTKISKEQSEHKMCKVINKTILKGKKTQLNLYDGKNVLVDKDIYSVGDTVFLSKNKVTKHIKLQKGALIYITKGRHAGTEGTLQEVKKGKEMLKDSVVVKTKKETFETLKDYAFAIEKTLQ